MEDGYVVAAKPSARRASGTVGGWIAASGCHRRFDSKASAREFARAASPEGRTLWVQDAHPLDPTEAIHERLSFFEERIPSFTALTRAKLSFAH